MTPDDLRFAIMSGDSASISKAPGVGKKTAERITLELRDKLKVTEDDMLGRSALVSADDLSGNMASARDEAVAALVALGYNSTDSMKAVRKIIKSNEEAAGDTEMLLKLALKEMLR